MVHYVQISADGLTLAGGASSSRPTSSPGSVPPCWTTTPGRPSPRSLPPSSGPAATSTGSSSRRAPRGVDAGHPRVELARRKAMAAGLNLGAPPWLAAPDGVREVARAWRRFTPLMDWVDRHMEPPEPAQIISNPASCFGGSNGSLSVNAAGGTAGYSYLWTPGGAIVNNPSGLNAGNYSVVITDANGCTLSSSASVTEPLVLSVNSNSLPASCFNGSDGSATANVSGGTAGYTYSWFPSGGTSSTALNLTTGNYTVTITDANGCTQSSSASVLEPAAIILNTNSTPSTCGSANGTADVIVAGGAAPYSYLWSPSGGNLASATNLASNNYTVVVTDANGCTMTATSAVSSLGGPAIQASTINDVSCAGGNNGSATSLVSSGNGPYSYLWSPLGGNAATANNLSAGAYSVSITDANGCTSVANINIAEPSSIIAQTVSSPALCFGDASGSAGVNVAGGSGSYSYLWTPGNSVSANPSGLLAGNYSVVITDANGCTTTAAANISEPLQINLNLIPTNALCNGSSDGSAQVNVAGGTAGYSYSWFPTGGLSSSALNLPAGNYTVTITDANGCTSSGTTTIGGPAAINLATSSTPATCGSANGSANVIANGGAQPYSYSWSNGGGTNSNATNLTATTYTVTVSDANGCTSTASESVSNTGGPTINTNILSNVSCNGMNDGSASVNVASGTAPYIYQWSPSGGNGQNATNLSAGNFSITVTDANGCVTNDNVVISEPTAIVAQISSTDANCAGLGGSANVNVAGGTIPYTYSWTGSASTSAQAAGLTGGNYTVTITDLNGCTASQSTTVNQAGGIATAVNAINVTCNGGSNGSATVIANGGSGSLSYSWFPNGGTSNVANNLSAGNYSVTVSDASGCVSTANIQVTEPAAINLITSSTPALADLQMDLQMLL